MTAVWAEEAREMVLGLGTELEQTSPSYPGVLKVCRRASPRNFEFPLR